MVKSLFTAFFAKVLLINSSIKNGKRFFIFFSLIVSTTSSFNSHLYSFKVDIAMYRLSVYTDLHLSLK